MIERRGVKGRDSTFVDGGPRNRIGAGSYIKEGPLGGAADADAEGVLRVLTSDRGVALRAPTVDVAIPLDREASPLSRRRPTGRLPPRLRDHVAGVHASIEAQLTDAPQLVGSGIEVGELELVLEPVIDEAPRRAVALPVPEPRREDLPHRWAVRVDRPLPRAGPLPHPMVIGLRAGDESPEALQRVNAWAGHGDQYNLMPPGVNMRPILLTMFPRYPSVCDVNIHNKISIVREGRGTLVRL